MQYWDGNAAGLNGGAVYYSPHGEDSAHDAYSGNGNGAYALGTGGAKGPGGANGYGGGPRRAVPAFPPSMSYARQTRTKEKKRRWVWSCRTFLPLSDKGWGGIYRHTGAKKMLLHGYIRLLGD